MESIHAVGKLKIQIYMIECKLSNNSSSIGETVVTKKSVQGKDSVEHIENVYRCFLKTKVRLLIMRRS